MVIKGKDRLRKYPRLEEAWETRQLSALWAPGLEKDIRGTVGRRGTKSVDWLIGLHLVNFQVVVIELGYVRY